MNTDTSSIQLAFFWTNWTYGRSILARSSSDRKVAADMKYKSFCNSSCSSAQQVNLVRLGNKASTRIYNINTR